VGRALREAAAGDEEEDEEFEKALLMALMKVKGAKDAIFEFIVCEGKPHWGVMLAKKIGPKHKAMLTEATELPSTASEVSRNVIMSPAFSWDSLLVQMQEPA